MDRQSSIKKLLESNYIISAGLRGVIGLEGASSYWGLSSFPSEPLIVLSSFDIRSKGIEFIKVPRLDTDTEVIVINSNILLTSPRRTIVDMIEYGAEYKILIESIETYLDEFDNEELLNYADKRGYKKELLHLIDEVDEYYEEF